MRGENFVRENQQQLRKIVSNNLQVTKFEMHVTNGGYWIGIPIKTVPNWKVKQTRSKQDRKFLSQRKFRLRCRFAVQLYSLVYVFFSLHFMLHFFSLFNGQLGWMSWHVSYACPLVLFIRFFFLRSLCFDLFIMNTRNTIQQQNCRVKTKKKKEKKCRISLLLHKSQ